MSNYNTLKATIDANVKQNGNQAITGSIMNSVLNQMVTTLGAGYQYMGVAIPTTNPGTPDAKVFYVAATPGTYTNFKNSSNVALEVADGEVAILKYDTSWSKEVTGAATAAQVTQLGQEVSDYCIQNRPMTADSIADKNKIVAGGDLGSASNNMVVFFDVENCSSVNISLTTRTGSAYPILTYALYNSVPGSASSSSFISGGDVVNNTANQTYTYLKVDCSTAKTLAICNARDATYSVTENKKVSEILQEEIDKVGGYVSAIENNILELSPIQVKRNGQINATGSSSGNNGSITSAVNPRVIFYYVEPGDVLFIKSYVDASNTNFPKLGYAFYSVRDTKYQDETYFVSGSGIISGQTGAFEYNHIIVPDTARMLVVMANNGHDVEGTDFYVKSFIKYVHRDGIVATKPILVPGEQRYLTNGDYDYVSWPYSTPIYDAANHLLSVFYSSKKTHAGQDNGVFLMKQLNTLTGVWGSPILVAGEPETPGKTYYGYATIIADNGDYIALVKDNMFTGNLYICRSSDFGATWTKNAITIGGVQQVGDCPCSLIKTENGRYMCFVAIQNYILYSDDGFATFDKVTLGSLGYQPYEGGLVQLGNGTICLLLRQNRYSGVTRSIPLLLKSTDDGATWSSPVKAYGLDADECPVAIKRDAAGHNYLYYISRFANAEGKYPFHIMVLSDAAFEAGIFDNEKTLFQTYVASRGDTGYGGVAIDDTQTHWWFFYNMDNAVSSPRIWFSKIKYNISTLDI